MTKEANEILQETEFMEATSMGRLPGKSVYEKSSVFRELPSLDGQQSQDGQTEGVLPPKGGNEQDGPVDTTGK